VTTKEALHRLIDDLPDEQLPAAEQFLVDLRDRTHHPLRHALRDAPVDDEAESDDERTAVQVARAELARGEVITDEELWRRLRHAPAR